MADKTEVKIVAKARGSRTKDLVQESDAAQGFVQALVDQSGIKKPKVSDSSNPDSSQLEVLSQLYAAQLGPRSQQKANQVYIAIENLATRINSLVDDTRALVTQGKVHPLAILHGMLDESSQAVNQTLDLPVGDTSSNSTTSTGDRVVAWARTYTNAGQIIERLCDTSATDVRKSDSNQRHNAQHPSLVASISTVQKAATPRIDSQPDVAEGFARSETLEDYLFDRLADTRSQQVSEDEKASSLGTPFEDGDVVQSVEHERNYAVDDDHSQMDADDDDYRESSESFQGIDRDRLSSPSCSPPPTPTPASRPRPPATAPHNIPHTPRKGNTRTNRTGILGKRNVGVAFQQDRERPGTRTAQSEPKKKIQCLR